ncbi:MAG: hypothetical protein PHN92_02095 [Geobacter sp.]|nr:hypothetical protein [Geobacter sp.]
MSESISQIITMLRGGLFDNPDTIRAEIAEARCRELEQRITELLDYFHQKRRITSSAHAVSITADTSH